MRNGSRLITLVAIVATLTALTTGTAWAQRAGRSGEPMELSATYGSMWGGNLGLRNGKLRLGTGPAMGFNLDVPIGGGRYVEAGYTRQDGSLDWDPRLAAKTSLSDMSVNFWQLGALQTFSRPGAPFIPFATGSLGATYMSPSAGSITIDGTDYPLNSVTKFSITFGVGFKAYFGQAQKVGLRGSFKVLSTLYDAGAGIFFGPGGVDLGISGSGIWQYEAAGGLTVRFGG